MPQFKYVIRAEGCMAVAVHSDMNFLEFEEYVREHSEKFHPKGRDTLFRIGVIELVNPVVMMASDFVNFSPFLIGVE